MSIVLFFWFGSVESVSHEVDEMVDMETLYGESREIASNAPEYDSGMSESYDTGADESRTIQ